MTTLWIKARRGLGRREQCELGANVALPCCFDVGIAADWDPTGLREGDRMRIRFDGSRWSARLLSGDLSANGLQIVGELGLYAPMVLRLGCAYFFVDDVSDFSAVTVSAAELSHRHEKIERELQTIVSELVIGSAAP